MNIYNKLVQLVLISVLENECFRYFDVRSEILMLNFIAIDLHLRP